MLGFRQKIAVGQPGPTLFESGSNGVIREVTLERERSSLIEENFHAPESTRGQTRFGEFQNSFDLFSLNSREPIEKFVDRGAGFKVFEQCADWDTGVFKHPRSADFFGISFYDGAIVPVEHAERIRQSQSVGKITGSTWGRGHPAR